IGALGLKTVGGYLVDVFRIIEIRLGGVNLGARGRTLALGDIDVDIGAEGPDGFDVPWRSDVEALQGKGCLGPRAVEPGNKHSQHQVLRSNLNLLDTH